jgi:lambda family phage portal protein
MGFIDRLFGRHAPSEPAVSPGSEQRQVTQALVPVSGVSSAQMGFMDGTDGKRSLTWARYNAPIITGGYFGTAPGSEVSRERSTAAAVTADMLTSNSVVATLVENFATYAIGNGLTLSSRPAYDALGITPEAARELATQIERAWLAWIMNPVECDASGRHTLHQQITAAFKSWLVTGETLAVLDWRAVPGALTKTKLSLLDSRQLDQTITRTVDGGASVLQGVQFDKNGALQGYWLRETVLGNYNSAPQAVFVRAKTSWGRQRVVHLFDLLLPGQIRGLSPLIATLTAAHSKGTLREFGLAAALVQTMVAATIESDLPSAQAFGSINVGDFGGTPGATPAEWLKARGDFYETSKVSLQPGVIGHLMQGDRLKIHRAESPNGTFESFDNSLGREAAKAAGSSVESFSGDYSKTSFSASRLAEELPWRINTRRRSAIVEPLYRAVYKAWLEEQCETGNITLPKGAPAFWEAPDAYTASMWRGSGKPVADPFKAAQADILEIENGLSTLEAKLGERGLDFEETLAQRKAEREQLEAAGFT